MRKVRRCALLETGGPMKSRLKKLAAAGDPMAVRRLEKRSAKAQEMPQERNSEPVQVREGSDEGQKVI